MGISIVILTSNTNGSESESIDEGSNDFSGNDLIGCCTDHLHGPSCERV